MPALLLRFLPHILVVASILGLLSYVYIKGRTDVKREVEIKSLTVTLEEQEDLNEIRNNRPSDTELFDSLYNGDF